MSLINDALKRAAADKPRDTQSAPAVPPLQPVDTIPTPGTSPVLLGGVLLLGVGAVAIGAALWFKGRTGTQPLAQGPGLSRGNVSPALAPAPAPAAEQQNSSSQIQSTETAAPAPQNPVAQARVRLQAVAAHNENPEPVVTPERAISTPAPTVTQRTAETVAKTVPPPVATTASVASESRPPRLQSIFYRMKNPTVIINGKTLKIGDSADGFRVTSIQRTSAEIVLNGKYRTLTLQD